jgi:hypothetical protein
MTTENDYAGLIQRLERAGRPDCREAAAAIRHLARSKDGPATLGRLVVYFGRRDVEVDGEPVGLSMRELDIVQTFARHPYVWVSHSQLSALTGSTAESAPRVYIHAIRSKINPVLGFDVFERRHQMGYRLSRALMSGYRPYDAAPVQVPAHIANEALRGSYGAENRI